MAAPVVPREWTGFIPPRGTPIDAALAACTSSVLALFGHPDLVGLSATHPCVSVKASARGLLSAGSIARLIALDIEPEDVLSDSGQGWHLSPRLSPPPPTPVPPLLPPTPSGRFGEFGGARRWFSRHYKPRAPASSIGLALASLPPAWTEATAISRGPSPACACWYRGGSSPSIAGHCSPCATRPTRAWAAGPPTRPGTVSPFCPTQRTSFL
jgi:hypothetical protein